MRRRAQFGHRVRSAAVGLVVALTAVHGGGAVAETGLSSAFADGKPIADFRLRFERVDQANKSEDARAITFRARLGFQTGQYDGFAALADFDLVGHVGPQDYFDSIGGRSPARFPTIADPDMATLNRLQLSYTMPLPDELVQADASVRFTLGRQRIILGDARFVGNAGWRQHEQTFDAVSAVATFEKTTFTYAYIIQVNRVFGPDNPAGRFDSRSHLFNAIYGGLAPYLKFEAYAYLLDLREAPALSTATYGIRGEGSFDLGNSFTAILNGAYARQSGYASNPRHVDLPYYLGEAGIRYRDAALLVGNEILEGDGIVAFQTPLATLHAYQGWAEVFLTKPPNGIDDLYVKGRYALSAPPLFDKLSATLAYHNFSAAHGRADYGDEWDAGFEATLKGVTIGSALASYRGANVFPNKSVVWIYANFDY